MCPIKQIVPTVIGDGTVLLYILYQDGDIYVRRERPQSYKIGDGATLVQNGGADSLK